MLRQCEVGPNPMQRGAAHAVTACAPDRYYDPEFDPDSESGTDAEESVPLHRGTCSDVLPARPASRGEPTGGAASPATSGSGRERLIPNPNLPGSETGTSAATLDANPGSPSAASAAGSAAAGSVTERLRGDPYGGIAAARRALAPRSEGATSSMAAELDAELAELRRAAPRSDSSAGGGMTLVRGVSEGLLGYGMPM